MALITAGGEPIAPTSPQPFTPSGLCVHTQLAPRAGATLDISGVLAERPKDSRGRTINCSGVGEDHLLRAGGAFCGSHGWGQKG